MITSVHEIHEEFCRRKSLNESTSDVWPTETLQYPIENAEFSVAKMKSGLFVVCYKNYN